MAKKHKKPPAKTAAKYTKDGFSNPAARIGEFTDNLLEHSKYFINRLTADVNLMTALYRNNWIVKRLIDVVPEDMLKQSYSLISRLDADAMRSLKRVERQTRLRSDLLTGLKWGRLYGGAAGVIIIDRHDNILDEPLELDDIMPDDFKGMIILDRHSGIMPSDRLISDYTSPNFGEPEYYQITVGHTFS